jgi:hypothetical protein
MREQGFGVTGIQVFRRCPDCGAMVGSERMCTQCGALVPAFPSLEGLDPRAELVAEISRAHHKRRARIGSVLAELGTLLVVVVSITQVGTWPWRFSWLLLIGFALVPCGAALLVLHASGATVRASHRDPPGETPFDALVESVKIGAMVGIPIGIALRFLL